MNRVRRVRMSTMLRMVLERWKGMLAVALLLAAVFGARQVKKLWPYTDANGEKTEQQTGQTAGSDASEESTSTYQKELERINREIASRQDYLANSLLAQLDFANVSYASFDIYVDESKAREQAEKAAAASGGTSEADYSWSSDEANALLRWMNIFISSRLDLTDLAKKLDTKPVYVKELFSTVNYDTNAHALTFQTRGRTDEEAAAIRDEVLRQVQKADFSSVADPELFSIVVTGKASYHSTENGSFGWHSARVGEINSLMTAKDTFKTNIDRNRSSAAVTAATSKTSAPVMSRRHVLVSSVKHAAAGFAAGAVLFFICCVLVQMARGRVLSAREFNELYQIRKLGVVPKKDIGTLRGLGRWAAGIDRRYLSAQDPATAYRIAAENLNHFSGGAKRIVLIGDVRENLLADAASSLSGAAKEGASAILPISRFSGDPGAWEKLESCDAVVMAASVEESSYAQTDDLMNIVTTYGKPVLGSLVI